MFSNIKAYFRQIFKARIIYLVILFSLMSAILLLRLFQMQIINGQDAQNKYILKVIKTKELKSTRGNIFDRDGKLLAYNELAYGITIEDNGSYTSTDEKNETINASILSVLHALDANGDKIDNDFYIKLTSKDTYEFTVEGTRLQRFRADVYGKTTIDDHSFMEFKYIAG